MRKFLYTVGLAAVILLNITVVRASNDVYYTNLNGIEMTEREYNNLLNLGFSEKQISTLDEEQFLDRKDIEGELLSEEKKFIKMTTTIINGIKYTTSEVLNEQDYQEAVLQVQQPTYSPNVSGSYYDGLSYTDYLEVSTQISYVDDITFMFKVNVDWDNIPSDRYYDILGIGFNQNKVHIVSPIFFKEEWVTTNNVSGYRMSGYTKTENTGGSVMIELPTGSLSDLTSYAYFDVAKNSGVGTLTYVEAVGDFAHADVYYDPGQENGVYYNYTVNIGGISVHSPHGSHYFSNEPATAAFAGTW